MYRRSGSILRRSGCDRCGGAEGGTASKARMRFAKSRWLRERDQRNSLGGPVAESGRVTAYLVAFQASDKPVSPLVA